MRVLAIDLAAKFSAGVVTEQGKVLFEFDSWGRSQLDFSSYIAEVALEYDVDMVMVEDLPYGLSKQFQTKPATRLQGIVIRAMYDQGLLSKTLFVNPIEWQKKFKVNKGGGSTPREVAERLGYTQRLPIEMYADQIPPLGKEHSKQRAKVRAQLKKASEDYDDAFLIAVWSELEYKAGTLMKYKGVQSYEG